MFVLTSLRMLGEEYHPNKRLKYSKLWSNISQMKHQTWCNTVQDLFLQSHSTCFGRKRPKHVEWLCRNKTCTVLRQVGDSFDLYYDARKHKIKMYGVTSCLVVDSGRKRRWGTNSWAPRRNTVPEKTRKTELKLGANCLEVRHPRCVCSVTKVYCVLYIQSNTITKEYCVLYIQSNTTIFTY